ncbi:site-specific integrase [Streptomyces sp. HUAS TT20]|uniref:site-specific integrase n=1 Tax=Streptomyces sp. HUAS TT20 TaxID=3447509 RepID=UPI0021D9DE2D|nr:site-specific integrase [Streptomyces sp. HUAS 15-9]UXY27738.1 site-specific integrase [Streptomyces sp. HUAS 15-9]
MASIVERPQKSGAITCQVKWRRGGSWQTENFGSEDPTQGSAQDEQFKALVEAHGNKWPHGWVKGHGFVETPPTPGDVPFVDYATRYVGRLTGIDDRTRDDYRREVRIHLSLVEHTDPYGRTVPATVCNVTQDDVTDWVRHEEDGDRDPSNPEKWLRREVIPRASATGTACSSASSRPPSIPRRSCAPRTRARTHDSPASTTTPRKRCASSSTANTCALRRRSPTGGPGPRRLTRRHRHALGEATALQVRDLNLNADVPTANVQRAWKRAKKGSDAAFYLGPPKTRKAAAHPRGVADSGRAGPLSCVRVSPSRP